MALEFITGLAGGADITIAATSYKTILSRFRLRFDSRQIDVTTFNDEPYDAFIGANSVLRFDMAGFGTFNAVVSGPLVPSENQNKAFIFTFATACTISFTGNIESGDIDRGANQLSIITASGVSRGAIVKAWDVTP